MIPNREELKGKPTGYRIDLVVFSDQRWLREASALCEPVQLEEAARDGFTRLRDRPGNASTCWVVPYPRPPVAVWHGYPFVASFHYLRDERVAEMLTGVYGYGLKTDFDCFLTATLVQHFPYRLEMGRMHYTLLPDTSARLRRVAAELGLAHRGVHDVGPTWHGDVRSLVALANASLPLVHHLLDSQFAKEPDGSWRQNWAAGEGWPVWSKDMAVMYAADIAINHLVEEFEVSNKYDVHADTEKYTFTLYHIHSQHDDKDFSKFEFFKHKYAHRDISTGLDFNLVKDYALWLAVSTWRHVKGLQQQQQQQRGMEAAAADLAWGVLGGDAMGADVVHVAEQRKEDL
ncbi:hypothetical protein GPECTOR_2g1172 [Gonium pectorale]|uniref:DUF7164 domain-containing protein n=1 Tax=Gonium pectorale TaxID=33097 RepID=A0A150H0W3_GONPE|nr:hypothetical protein GPECTOR_2g1172 [Gonium pectorale]|eukprot:KXZ55622.1 hypothetical protein GPECTOR_2g1172 [Gonium pectorale]